MRHSRTVELPHSCGQRHRANKVGEKSRLHGPWAQGLQAAEVASDALQSDAQEFQRPAILKRLHSVKWQDILILYRALPHHDLRQQLPVVLVEPDPRLEVCRTNDHRLLAEDVQLYRNPSVSAYSRWRLRVGDAYVALVLD